MASPEHNFLTAPAPVSPAPRTGLSRQAVIGLVILGLVGVGAVAYVLTSKHPAPGAPEPSVSRNLPAESFAPDVVVTSVYTEQSPPLAQVSNFAAVKQKYQLALTADQELFLDRNRFLLVDAEKTSFTPGVNFDQMLEDFDSMRGGSIYERKPEDARLVTPDIVLHAYHKYFELTLEELEQHELNDDLGDFLTGLHSNLAAAARSSTGYLKERYENLQAQIVLARVLLENRSPAKPDSFANPDQEAAYNEKDKTIDTVQNAKVVLQKYSSDLTPELAGKIQTELDYIYASSAPAASPLFGQYNPDLSTDYTQFTPRSHYTKNSTLRAYFRTMMYLGRSSYFLKSDVGIVDSNLLARQFTVKSGTGTPIDTWNKIMTITGFYAGQSDDLTYTEWNDYETRILGSSGGTDADLVSPTAVQKLAQSLNQLRLPKIFSDIVINENITSMTKADLLRQSLAFRIFGQRFTFDAWVLNDLTAGMEKTEVRLPSTPSALFVSAALGDAKAQVYAKQFLQKDAGFTADQTDAFGTKLEQKKAEIQKITKAEWFGSMGSAWLYVLSALTHAFGEHYPRYMQAVSFLDKQIQTFLGSYAELKHDTLLYAKQSYAELGGGGGEGDIPPVVKGFVEPNMDFWNKFNALLNHTEWVFTQNGLFKGGPELDRLREFKDISRFYTDIAKKELLAQPISDDDYEKLRTTGLWFMAVPFQPGDPDEDSGKVALIADIHTDAFKSQILYEATARPYVMLAIVGNEQTPRVVAGLVFNHYELTNPLGKRLTDEDWRSWVYGQPSRLPAKNFWYQSLFPVK